MRVTMINAIDGFYGNKPASAEKQILTNKMGVKNGSSSNPTSQKDSFVSKSLTFKGDLEEIDKKYASDHTNGRWTAALEMHKSKDRLEDSKKYLLEKEAELQEVESSSFSFFKGRKIRKLNETINFYKKFVKEEQERYQESLNIYNSFKPTKGYQRNDKERYENMKKEIAAYWEEYNHKFDEEYEQMLRDIRETGSNYVW